MINEKRGKEVLYDGTVSGSVSGPIQIIKKPGTNYANYITLLYYFRKVWCETPQSSGLPSDQTIQINEAIVGHTQQSQSGGRVFQIYDTPLWDYRYQVINDIIKPYAPNASPDWYNLDKISGVSINAYAYGPPFNVARDEVQEYNGLYVNSEGRYWVAVGPTVMNGEVKNGRIVLESMEYGTNIDLLLKNTETDEEVWVYGVIGDVKAHTAAGYINGQYIDGQGVFQTGFTFDGGFAPKNVDASMVEFIGDSLSGISGLYKYQLLDMVVYD